MPLHVHRNDVLPPPSTSPILVPLESLRPTQAAVGPRAVERKRRKIARRLDTRRRLSRFLLNKPIPSVRGPGGELFIIDRHHLGLALWQAEIEQAFIYLIDDLSVLPVATFWARMERAGRIHPYDENGRRIRPTLLPKSLGLLAGDSYRDLAWSVREAGGFEKTSRPFAEFLWADYFRERVPSRLLRRNYDAAVSRALKLAGAREAAALPGYRRD